VNSFLHRKRVAGHFHLVNQVFDLVKASPRARVVTVASEAHRFGQLDAGDLNYQTRAYKKWEAYGQVGWGPLGHWI
jgi:NAD(P)-dependent dehydrogenase (short-subunit alcohol dehydrogenase family)